MTDAPPVISVIMPAYNASDCVARAMESALSQTFGQIELIAVDDGSTDGTGEIIASCAGKDSRVTALRQANSGAALARNLGLDAARGRYIAFLDADDWMEGDMLRALYTLAEENALDIAIGGFCVDTRLKTGVHRRRYQSPPAVYETAEAFHAAAARLFDSGLVPPVWNKLYRAGFLKGAGLRFTDTFMDDFPFNIGAFRAASRVGVTDAALYHCTRGERETLTTAPRDTLFRRRCEEYQWMKSLLSDWNVFDNCAREVTARRFAERAVGCLADIMDSRLPVTFFQRRREARALLQNEILREALPLVRNSGALMTLALRSLNTRCAPLCMAEGWIMAVCRRRLRGAFERMRAGK